MTERTHQLLTDTQTDVEAPITSELMKALAFNPVSTFQGDSNVPNDERGRLEMFQRLVPGGDVVFNSPGLQSSSSTSFSTMQAFAFAQSGAIRVSFECAVTNSGSWGRYRIARLRAGGETTVSVSPRFTNESYISYSVDVPVEIGDIIQLQLDAEGLLGSSSLVRKVTLSTDRVQYVPVCMTVERLANWRNV